MIERDPNVAPRDIFAAQQQLVTQRNFFYTLIDLTDDDDDSLSTFSYDPLYDAHPDQVQLSPLEMESIDDMLDELWGRPWNSNLSTSFEVEPEPVELQPIVEEYDCDDDGCDEPPETSRRVESDFDVEEESI